jgi:hypothetical protein
MRRDFLKTAAAGAAGAVGLSALKFDKIFAQSTGGWVSGMQVNPAIDNMRVICCHDTNMLTSTPTNTTFTSQNAAVNATLVASNMDQMAMQLAQKATATDAWSTIFRSSKPWASTKVAIKTNAIIATGNHPRVAVIKKICDVFVDQLGVPAANIILYDANSDASKCYSTYASLTDSTKIRATVSVKSQSLGGQVGVTIAASTKTMSGVADLVNGVIDILVDVAIIKRHSGPGTAYAYGSCSLCMKNHLGTFINSGSDTGAGDASATGLHSIDAICNINKHAAILGGTPVRQQLCFIDGLLANANSAGGSFDTRVDRLIMGTFAPIVDYLTAMRIMQDVMDRPDANNNVPKFLTNFDYAETDPLQWVEYVPGSAPPIGGNTGSSGGATGSGGTTSNGGSKASGGTPASAGTTSPGGSKASGGTPASAGTTSPGGSKANGGATASGGTTSASGSGSTGGTATSSGGSTPMGGATTGSGGSKASSGTPGNGGANATGGASTSSALASGGSSTTGGMMAGAGTTASPVGASGGSTGTTGTAHAANSSGGCDCDVAGGDRSASRWGAMLALGAVVAGKLRRFVSGDDRSS